MATSPRFRAGALGALFAVAASLLVPASPAAAEPEYLSPGLIAASPDGQRLYVAANTSRKVLVVEASSGQVTREFTVPSPPQGLALSRDAARLYVTCGVASGQILALNTASGAPELTLATGHNPVAPVLDPERQRLYVGLRFENAVVGFDLNTGKPILRIPIPREPIAACLSPDGSRLFVANHLPAQASTDNLVAAVVTVVDLARQAVSHHIPLPNGSTGVRDLCLAADGRHLYVPHALARYQMPTTQLERGWMNTAALTLIDVARGQYLNSVLLDDVDLGAANPWGVATSADGRWIAVTHAGTHELSLIDQPALLQKLERVHRGERVSEVSLKPEDVPNDLSFLVDLRRRIPLTGKSPRNLTVLGTRAFVTECFSDSLGVVDLAATGRPKAQSFPLGPTLPLSQIRQGEIFFHDASLCFQHWQSCASCHPDSRVDALNWDLLNDGIGTPKNTRNMLLAHATPPSMSLGVRASTEAAVRAGIRVIQFAVRPEEDAVAIDEYLKALQPVPSPHRLPNGQLSKSAQRGEKIFRRAGCAECHPAPLFTDLKSYNVGTGTNREVAAEFDTPTLIECWRTGPYLHDGRATTLEEVFQRHNPDNAHGRTSKLSPRQLADLIAYVLSQ